MILRIARTAALWGIALLVAASTLTAFAESYRALYLWAVRHDVPAGWALVWPAMVDVFIAVGELALFVALADRWAVRSRLFAWSVTLAGLAVSVAANVGHVAGHSLTARATAAVPPLAAAAALAVGLGVLKRCAAGATGSAASDSRDSGAALAGGTMTPRPPLTAAVPHRRGRAATGCATSCDTIRPGLRPMSRRRRACRGGPSSA